jgi:EmrB/QacA subfamily drug resistance transporter
MAEVSAAALPRHRLMVPLVVAFAFFLEGLDSTIIATAIPAMAEGLGETPLRLNLALTAYLLSAAVFIPVSGWVADRFGMRNTFTAAVGIFALGSMASGLAPDLATLVGARAVQGFGGALMAPVGRLILLRSFPRSEFATAISYMNIPSVIGPTMGPLLGGLIAGHASWRWIFFVGVPFCLLGMVLAWRHVKEVDSPPPSRFDGPGFAMVGIAMLALQTGMFGLGRGFLPQPVDLALLGGAALLIATYVRWSLRRPNAALDFRQMRVRSFRVALIWGGITRIGMNAVPFLLPLMLQLGFGMSPVLSGSLTFVMSLGTILARTMAVKLLRALGFDRLLLFNTVASAAATAGFALLDPATPHLLIAAWVLVFGMVRNIQFNTLQTLTYSDMPSEGLSKATSLGGGIQQLTMGIGVSVGASLLAIVAGSESVLPAEDFRTVFLLAALVPLLALPGIRTLRPQDGATVSGHRRPAT